MTPMELNHQIKVVYMLNGANVPVLVETCDSMEPDLFCSY